MSYPHGPNIRSRSIAEIASGKLHHYGIEQIPHNPYAYGSLRHLFRTSSIRRRSDPTEQLHLKSEVGNKELTDAEKHKIERDIEKDLERQAKEQQRKREEDLETGGAEIG